MKVRLTDALLRTIKPPKEGRTVLNDTERPGLRFRMTSNGHASFIFEKKVKGGKRRSFTLGPYPAVSLARARAEALQIEAEAAAGIDRVELAARDAALNALEKAAQRTVQEVLDIYFVNHIEQNLKSGQHKEERKRQLLNCLQPFIQTPISELTKSNLQQIIDAKASEGKVPMANRLRAALKHFSRWAHQRDYIGTDIGAGIPSAGKERSRLRTPSIDEVREIWQASYELGDLWGPFFRLAILLCQRNRSEILVAEWEWIDLSKRQLLVPDPKNRQPHITHLCDTALSELEVRRSLQREHANPEVRNSKYVFTTNGRTPSSGVSKAKKRLDAHINTSRQMHGLEPIKPWTIHDLRRSQATALAEAGFDEGVVDRLQNHVAGGSRPSVVSAVYNLADRMDERAKALDAWADMVVAH